MKKQRLQICLASLCYAVLPLVVSAGLISESSSDARVTGEENVGGLIGHATGGIIEHSHSAGEVRGFSAVGGLVGLIENADVSGCHASGSVEAEEWDAGGLVGVVIDSGTIADSFASGSVVADEVSGGLVGYIGAGSISRCYATGSVSDDWGWAGGLIGELEAGVAVVTSYWNTQTSGQTTSAGGDGRITTEMTYPHAENTYADWDFETIWAADTDGAVNRGYPYLIAPVGEPPPGETGKLTYFTESPAFDQGGAIILRWNSVPGRSYGFKWSHDLADWQTLKIAPGQPLRITAAAEAEDSDVSFDDPSVTLGAPTFFRVLVFPEP